MDQVDRWLRGYPTESTREKYGLGLRHFCKHYGVTWEDTLGWSVERAEDAMIDWKNDMLDRWAGKTIRLYFTAVKGWFVFNRIRIMVQCKNVPASREIVDYIPVREDVQRLLDGAKLHHKVAIALLAFSGLRPVDVIELEYQNIKASLLRGDKVLTILKQHRKTRQWYVGFIGTQGTRYLEGYLQARKEKGEVMTDTTPVVRWKHGAFTSAGLRSSLRLVIDRTVGKHPTGESFRRFRPYCLRKYFRRTVNLIGFAEAEYLMGHSEGLEGLAATYGGLRDLDPVAIQQLKRKYIEILPELETEITDTTLKVKIEKMEKERGTMAERLQQFEAALEQLERKIDSLD